MDVKSGAPLRTVRFRNQFLKLPEIVPSLYVEVKVLNLGICLHGGTQVQ